METSIHDILSGFEPSDKQAWAEAVKKAVRKEEELNALRHETTDGLQLVALYDKEDTRELPHAQAVPGEYPYAGGFPGFSGTRLRQRIFTEKFMLANQQATEALQNGADEIEFSGDSAGNEREFGTLLLGLDPAKHPLHFQLGENNNSLLFILSSEWEMKGYDLNEAQGSVYFSPFDRLVSTGSYDYSEADTKKLLKANMDLLLSSMPKFRGLSVPGVRFANAGAGDATELALACSMAVEYLDILTDQGFRADDVLKHMQFHISSGSDYLSSVAKWRALRMVWANISEAFGATVFPHFNAVSSEFNKSLYDIHNNMLRLTSESMSAMLGKADSFTAIPYNDRMDLPDAFSYRNTRNIWNLLRHESHLDVVQDPAAGAYYLEILTMKMAEAAWQLFTAIEKQGGFVAALQNKFIQGSVEKQYTLQLDAFRKGTQVLVGTNKYPDTHEKLSGKILRNVTKPELGEQFAVMPLPARYLSETLDEQRLKTETQELRKEAEADSDFE